MDSEDNITRRRALLAGGGVLAFGGGVAYVAGQSESSEQRYVPATSHSSAETTGFGVELAGRPIAGEQDAPVDIYYWTDYLDTGDARLVKLSYPNIGQYSMPAAIWGRCVWAQVRDSDPSVFWNWHSAIFDEQPDSGTDWADEQTFATVTEQTDGVDRSAVETCREERGTSIRESIGPNLDVARQSGIQGTPGFVIYNRESGAAGKLVGAHPYENFADAIEQVMES